MVSTQKNLLDVTIKQIARHFFGDNGMVRTDEAEVTLAFLRRDLEAHMQQLAQVRVEFLARLLVLQRVDVLFRSPMGHHGAGRELGAININDRGIGRT